MCGLVGALALGDAPLDPAALRPMADAVAHRGPDDAGYAIDAGDRRVQAFADPRYRHMAPELPVWPEEGAPGARTFLGHRRLSIIDLSPGAHQPMASADGATWLAYNGEIYNFRELRAELEASGRRFASRSDTEVLLQAFAEWDLGCLERLNGMFAFAVWQPQRRRLVLARDRYGIKPLYVRRDGDVLAFGSEVKAILALAPHVEVDLLALNEYFSFQNVFTQRTLFDGVRMLPPGHWLEVENGRVGEPQGYWDFCFDADVEDPGTSEEAQVEELYHTIEQAVGRQTVADVPIGAYLSGGLDSGVLTSIASRRLGRVHTYTLGFDVSAATEREQRFDERALAELVASRFETEHYECILHSGDVEAVLDDLVWHLEDLRVGQCYPNYYAARLASKFTKVVLSGAGGDEIFGGYPWRYAAALAPDAASFVDNYYRWWQRLVSNQDKRSLFNAATTEALMSLAGDEGTPFVDHTRTAFERVFPRTTHPKTPSDQVRKSLYFECKTFLHGLLVVEDKLSMAHSLESRVPFLDNDLVDFACRIPIERKVPDLHDLHRLDENQQRKDKLYERDWTRGKHILREAMARLLPPEIATAPKQGFSAPDESWFRGRAAGFVQERLLDPSSPLFQYLQPAFVEAVVKSHQQEKENKRLLIWSLLSLDSWLRAFR